MSAPARHTPVGPGVVPQVAVSHQPHPPHPPHPSLERVGVPERGRREAPASAAHEMVPPPRPVVREPGAARADRRLVDRRVASVVERMSDAFLALGPDWRVTYANHEAARLNGTIPAELVGLDHWAAWPETRGSEVEREYRRAAAERVPVAFEQFYPEAGVWHDIRAYPADDGGLAIFYRDITEQKRRDADRERLLAAEREARAEAERQRVEADRAREQAEAANAAKAQFLATMSHELRTPLTAIGGYAQLLELGIFGQVSNEQLEVFARIQRGQQHVLGLLNAVLRFAKLEAGRVQFDVEDVPLADVVATVAALLEPQARARRVTLEAPAPAPGLIARADAEKVRQIVVNLLSNAVKFTPAGGTVRVSAEARAGVAVALRVEDTGRGIAEHHRERIFEPFVQVARDPSLGEEGAGLGLAISRELARGMDGDLLLEATALGAGSTFALLLPAA